MVLILACVCRFFCSPSVCVCVCVCVCDLLNVLQTVYTKGTRAHTHRELIREWLWEPKGNSLVYEHTRIGN